MFPENWYSQEVEALLSVQNKEKTRRGADLPWWGKQFFSNDSGFRTMIISQDSLAKDAGSVALFAHLLPAIDTQNEYQSFTGALNNNQSFKFSSWHTIKRQIQMWGIDLNFLFITDAAKVYEVENSNKFNLEESRQLLKKEIDICQPDLIVLLGKSPMTMLNLSINYQAYFEDPFVFDIGSAKAVIAPLPIGLGRTQKNFQEKLKKATELIKGETIMKQSSASQKFLSFYDKKAIFLSFEELYERRGTDKSSFIFSSSKQRQKVLACELSKTGNGYVSGRGLEEEYIVDSRGWINVKNFTETELKDVIQKAIKRMSE